MRKMVIALCAALILGCGGLQELIEQVSDVEMDVKQGEDAVHPADFPLSAPDAGILMSSTNVSMRGMKTRAVVYQLATDADGNALLESYSGEIEALGHTPDRQGNRVMAQQEGGSMIAAEIANSGNTTVLTLTEVEIDLEPAPSE